MNVHSYYYGPVGKNGLRYEDTEDLTKIVNEDIIRRLYTKESKKPVIMEQLYQTSAGLVLGITFIEPAQAHDKRATYVNQTFFVKLSEIVQDIKTQLPAVPMFPLEALKLKVVRDG